MGRFDFGATFSQTFQIYFANIVPFAIIVAIVSIPEIAFDALGAFTAFGASPVFRLGSSVISLVVSSVVSGALTYGVLQEIRGNHVDVGESVSAGLKMMFPILGVALVAGLGVGLGLILLVVPGLILLTMWYVAVPAAVVEHTGVGDALRRSADLTSGSRWPVFGFILVMLLIVIGVSIVATLPVSLLEGGFAPRGGGALSFVIGTIVDVFLAALTGTATSVVYFQLRNAKEGFQTTDIAAVFD